MVSSEIIDWLLTGEPWVVYRTRKDLLNQPDEDQQVIKARQAMLDDPRVRAMLDELSSWPGKVLSSHKSAGQSFHKLGFLVNLGLKTSDSGISQITERILEHQSSEGPFQLQMNIGKEYKGNGEDTFGWALCDAPLVVYGLVKLGLGQDPRVQAAISALAKLIHTNGWPCVVSKELGTWRGPGRKADPCPYANLVMLKLLSLLPEWIDSSESRLGVETLLYLWEHSQEIHPYIFYMGTDFRKIKFPFIWYDILHVSEVLSHFPWVRTDERFLDMIEVIQAKSDDRGRYTPESIWKVWDQWDFGQKKFPSRGLTLQIYCILKRLSD